MPGTVPEAEFTTVPMVDKSLHSGVGKQTKARKEIRVSGGVIERDWLCLLTLNIQGYLSEKGHLSRDLTDKGPVLEIFLGRGNTNPRS